MPFTSKAQLQTCYKKNDPRWNCDEFLKKTPSVCCLPNKKGGHIHSRCMKNGERIKGSVIVGPKGGKYFELKEKDKSGVVCVVKVYIKR